MFWINWHCSCLGESCLSARLQKKNETEFPSAKEWADNDWIYNFFFLVSCSFKQVNTFGFESSMGTYKKKDWAVSNVSVEDLQYIWALEGREAAVSASYLITSVSCSIFLQPWINQILNLRNASAPPVLQEIRWCIASWWFEPALGRDGYTHPWSWLALPLRSWVSVGTVSRSQGSLEDESGNKGKASAKTATYRRGNKMSTAPPASQSGAEAEDWRYTMNSAICFVQTWCIHNPDSF